MMKRLLPFLLLLCGIVLPMASAASDWPAPLEATNPPVMAPDLSIRDGNGNLTFLSNMRGKVVILNIWATWCGPCVKEMPDLDALTEYAGALNLAIVPVSTDRGGAVQVQQFYQNTHIKKLPIYTDSERSVMRQIRPRGLPLTLIINPQGYEVARVYGPVEWTSEPVLDALRMAAGLK